MTVIESGPRWVHLIASAANLDPKFYLLALVRAVVDGGSLTTFAATSEEISFFATNNVTTVAAPTFVTPDDGYNAGNLLLGLCFASKIYYEDLHFLNMEL